jgi:8-oxo-dGTP pyrophosphatase MutT (NUDIX family)
MGISVLGHKLYIDLRLTIPLPQKYRGGGVAVFRINNGQPEVLLGLRAFNPGRGLWTFPGGGAEGREKLSAAAIREFREETGVQLYGRYITRTGIFHIKKFFFEWNTLIIESTQNIDLDKRLKPHWEKDNNGTLWEHTYGGEFLSLKWFPLSELKNLKLHRWVSEVVDFYTSDKMRPYKARPPKNELKLLSEPKKPNRVKTVRRETGESLLFDMAEMVLTKVDPDGTKYFQPVYQKQINKCSAVQEALYGM